jgi:hypothetical protein
MNVSFGQDTLVLKDGIVLEVSIRDISDKGVISYSYGKTTNSIEPDKIMRYYYKGDWYREVDGEFQKQKSSDLKLRGDFFRSNSSFNYGRFSISTNLIAPFLETDVFDWQKDDRLVFRQYTNRTFTLEPEFRFHEKFSLKLPVTVGLTSPPQSGQNDDISDTYRGSTFLGDYFRYEFYRDYETNTLFLDDFIVREFTNWNYFGLFRGHRKQLHFQMGFNPKFFPFGQKKHALYLSPSFIVGQMDYFQNDYYITIDTMIDVSQDYFGNWESYELFRVSEERFEQSSSKFWFMKWEVLIGMHFNWTKAINFSFETGYSSVVWNDGDPDRIFVKKPGTDFELHHTEYRFQMPSRLLGYIPARFNLVINIGAQRRNLDKQ